MQPWRPCVGLPSFSQAAVYTTPQCTQRQQQQQQRQTASTAAATETAASCHEAAAVSRVSRGARRAAAARFTRRETRRRRDRVFRRDTPDCAAFVVCVVCKTIPYPPRRAPRILPSWLNEPLTKRMRELPDMWEEVLPSRRREARALTSTGHQKQEASCRISLTRKPTLNLMVFISNIFKVLHVPSHVFLKLRNTHKTCRSL